jgi:hypothetical protein
MLTGRMKLAAQLCHGTRNLPLPRDLLMNFEAFRFHGKTKLHEAIRYATVRRADLERFLDDGHREIDNNAVERTIRLQTIAPPF